MRGSNDDDDNEDNETTRIAYESICSLGKLSPSSRDSVARARALLVTAGRETVRHHRYTDNDRRPPPDISVAVDRSIQGLDRCISNAYQIGRVHIELSRAIL